MTKPIGDVSVTKPIGDETFREAWSRNAALLFAEVTRLDGGPGVFRTTMNAFFKACPEVSERWSGATAAATRDRFVPGRKKDVAWYSAAYKCARMGHALTSGDGSWLSDPEVDWLARHGHEVTPSTRAPAGRSEELGDVMRVDFAFAFDGREGRRPKAFRSFGTATVERIPEGEVDETVVFHTRAGTKVEARRIGDAWMRTLVAPEGDGPMGEAAFVAACSGIAAWMDDPFRQRPAAVLSKSRVAPPAVVDSADGDGGYANARVRELALDDATVRPRRLASIGGTVHVATAPPALHVCLHVSAPEDGDVHPIPVPLDAVSLGWAMDDVDSETDFSPVGAVVTSPDWSCGYDLGRGRKYPAFALRDVAFAREFARRTAEHSGMAFGDATPSLPADALDALAAARSAFACLVIAPGEPDEAILDVVREAARLALDRRSAAGMAEAAATIGTDHPTIRMAAAKALCETTTALAFEEKPASDVFPDEADEEIAGLSW